MKSLKKLLEEKRIREEKKTKKEQEKLEKLKQKELEKKKKHKQKLRVKQNRRAYLKKRQVILDEKEKNGDVHAYHMVLIMKNNKKIRRIKATWWKVKAFEIYNEELRKNREEVSFPVNFTEKMNIGKIGSVKYEIMVIQRTDDNDASNRLRNKDGEFVENVITDQSNYIILAKDDWYIEETFNVYGYHPKKDRKTFRFILNEIILKNTDKYNSKRLFIYNNRLIIQSNDDFDFVTCKTQSETERLYHELQKKVDNKYVYFTGYLSKSLTSDFLDKMQEKTGWSRETCKRIHTL